jgi:L-ascorbate metabolism protein UlaG (beta-lactamase superfamily)
MKIKFYGYNAFIIEEDDKKLIIDPGAVFMYWFRFTTLIPKLEWKDSTHVFITHGDPDHYWHFDRVLEASGATLICNSNMRNENGLFLGPRSKGMAFDTQIDNDTVFVDPCKTVNVDDMTVTGIHTEHGPLTIRTKIFTKVADPAEDPRVGYGSVGFKIEVGGKTIVNLGDTFLMDSFKNLGDVDVLIIPVGGDTAANSMGVDDAIKAIGIIKPRVVIPCHYDLPVLFNKHYADIDTIDFHNKVEATGSKCIIMKTGDIYNYES